MIRLLIVLLLAAACNAMTLTVLGIYSNGAMLRDSVGIRLSWQDGGTYPGDAMIGYASPAEHIILNPRPNGPNMVTSYKFPVGSSSGVIAADLKPGATDPDPPGTLYAYKTMLVSNSIIYFAGTASQPFYIVPVPLTKTVVTNSGTSLTLRIDFNLARITPNVEDRISIRTNAGSVYQNLIVYTGCLCSDRKPTTSATIGSWTVTLTNPPADIYTIRFQTVVSGILIYATMPGQLQYNGQTWIVT